ncbi:transposase [Dehalococcoidia bacterium]|nr:transposase [Dehalococcoidia bacterium]
MAPLIQAEHDRQPTCWRQAGRTAEASGPSRGNRSNRLPEHRPFEASEAQRPPSRPGDGPGMKELGLHHSTTEKRRMKGHSLFSGFHELLRRRCLLAPQMYRQKATCKAEGIAFQSKIDMAVEQIQNFQPVEGTHTHPLMDCWYHCKQVRRASQRRGWDLSGGLKSNRKMQIIEADGVRRWVSLTEYACLSRNDFEPAVWPSQQGGRVIYAHIVRTKVRKLGACQVLISRESLDRLVEQVRCWDTTLLDADAQAVVNVPAIRWGIEVMFEDNKDLLGSDHYQVLSDKAILRFWTLIVCISVFLDEQRAQIEAAMESHVTWGDARRAIQDIHQRNLLSWIYQQFWAGATPTDVYALLNTNSV